MNEQEQLFRSRDLCRNATNAERLLWRQLKVKQVRGVQFRRQHPIEPYIVDFCAIRQRLVIELDGGQHNENAAADETRTKFLESRGYRVLRFWNYEVFQQLDAVLQVIYDSLGESKDAENLLD
ncbi:MAG TPA: DUF559 domain-containing protein [Bellilinea sp.]|nr:DUF559 domain-containing protein [Bellilinea sp.]